MIISFALIAIVFGIVVTYILKKRQCFQRELLYRPCNKYRIKKQKQIIGFGDLPRRCEDNPKGLKSPKDISISFKEVTITTKDKVQLQGYQIRITLYYNSWVLLKEEPEKYDTTIYFHEDEGNIGSRLYFMEFCVKKIQTNLIVCAYRGYSNSTGVSTEDGLKLDALAIIDFTLNLEQINKNRVFCLGRSIGANVAVFGSLLYESKLKGLVLDNPYENIEELLERKSLTYKKYGKWLPKTEKWDITKVISEIQIPMLFIKCKDFLNGIIIGDGNEYTNPEQVKRLFERATQSKKRELVKQFYI